MARPTMEDLLLEIRGVTNASESVWSNGTANYWDDQQLQNVLDQHRRDFENVPLTPIPSPAAGGSLSWFNYDLPYRYLEQASGTTIFTVFNAVGSAMGTAAFTVDYTRGVVTFTADTQGSAYYASGRTYDLYGAAAEVLERWAAHEALSFDFSADGQSFRRSQKVDMLTKMAVDCRGKAWPVDVTTARCDLNPSPRRPHHTERR